MKNFSSNDNKTYVIGYEGEIKSYPGKRNLLLAYSHTTYTPYWEADFKSPNILRHDSIESALEMWNKYKNWMILFQRYYIDDNTLCVYEIKYDMVKRINLD